MSDLERNGSSAADFGGASRWRWLLAALAAVALVVLRGYTAGTESVNWDEFNLIHNAAWTWQSGELHAGGRPGLGVLMLLPFVSDCHNEIEVVRRARVLWMILTLSSLVGFGLLLRSLGNDPQRRNRDALLGVALLALVPEFLVWSVQVRTDQLAILGALWGGVALIASRERPGLATAAGLLFGLGTLASQKALYPIALVFVLVLAEAWRDRDLRASRDGLRGVLVLSALGMVVVGYYALMPQLFSGGQPPSLSVPLPALSAETAGRQVQFQLSVFEYYRSTIGFSRYVEMLPHLVVHLGLLVATAGATLAGVLRTGAVSKRLVSAWAVIALGLGVGVFHAGAFKYFWMTLGIFPAVAAVLAWREIEAELERLHPALGRAVLALVWAALLIPAAFTSARLLEDTQAVQRETIDFARRNFTPSDAGFQAEAGLFCSDEPARFPPYFSQLIERRFGAASGCARCAPDLIREFEEQQVKFVVASFRLTQFPPLVREFWQRNYLPYRGSLLVAGRFLKAERDAGAVDLVVDGEYLWLPNNPPAEVSINGRRVRTGERVHLARGRHEVSFPKEATAGMLVLAMDEPPKLPLEPFYRDF
ncbi:MAG: hypothetical protein GY733_07075 [bacterium]|nr:hypothetical protein [bacterium]